MNSRDPRKHPRPPNGQRPPALRAPPAAGAQRPVSHFIVEANTYAQLMRMLIARPYAEVADVIRAAEATTKAKFADEGETRELTDVEAKLWDLADVARDQARTLEQLAAKAAQIGSDDGLELDELPNLLARVADTLAASYAAATGANLLRPVPDQESPAGVDSKTGGEHDATH